MKTVRTGTIIHLFALLHASVTLLCRLGGAEDELLLTILTMAMTLIICLQKRLRIEFTAAGIILVNITGYLMGNITADIIGMAISPSYLAHALSTAITTEALGWGMSAITRIFRHGNESNTAKPLDFPYLRWLILAMGGIFLLRFCIVFFLSDGPFGTVDIIGTSAKIFSNAAALIILICINILYVRFVGHKKLPSAAKFILLAVFMIAAGLMETITVGLDLPFNMSPGFGGNFLMLFLTSMLAQITVYCIVFMTDYAFTARTEMQEAKEKASMAQYRYVKLKHQVNPHFLFNSLNILDCLVCEQKDAQASTYIHKLAGIYRYMLKSEDEEVVPLRDELIFVGLYVDLLKVRFPEGFEVETEVPEGLSGKCVLPCSLQLLIENAIKHNTVNDIDNPLKIKIKADGDTVRVSNNIVPKVTSSPSTGLGLKYIRQLYLDLSGKTVQIGQEGEEYYVILPLL
ncbi:MAG: histidine kinase [Bacteroidales bacterium]|nr:histidine kinase [Bacteroidales bacterium]